MKKTVYALGFFDGIHLGHGALLEACRCLAEKYGLETGAVTFDAHPDTLVQGSAPGLITTAEDRQWLLRQRFSMDRVVTLPFDNAMRAMPWEQFLSLLLKEHGAGGFVCGEDFRFGHRGQGNAALLADTCRRLDLPWAVVPDRTLDGIRVSSTYIRSLLQTGNMREAVRFLGHPYCVTAGQLTALADGTLRLTLPPELAEPMPGTYNGRWFTEGQSGPVEAVFRDREVCLTSTEGEFPGGCAKIRLEITGEKE